MHAPLVMVGSIAALLTLAGCQSRSIDDLGVVRQAEGDEPKIGLPVDIAPQTPQPVQVDEEVFAARGDGYLAVFRTGSEMYATPFDAQGAPGPLGTIDLARCSFTGPLGASMAAACAPSGDCIVGCASEPVIDGPLTIVTLAADGTVGTVPTDIDDPVGLAIAFDGQAFVVVASSNASTVAFHFEGGAVVEPTPTEIAPNGAEVWVACAPDRRCMILAGQTAALQASDGSLGAPFSESWVFSGLTYGDGMYLTYSAFADQYGMVRFGMDGVALDPTPLQLATSTVKPVGAGFDGQFYNLLFSMSGNSMALARRASDGSQPSPAIVDLSALPVAANGTIACLQGSCACAADAPGTSALTSVIIEGDTPTLAADALAKLPSGQSLVKVLQVDAGAVVVWTESEALRARLFSTEGAPLADAVTITDAGSSRSVDGDGHGGLLLWSDSLGHDMTTVVHADGSIGPNVALTPPPTSSDDPARFLGILAETDHADIRAFRFDAAGHPLDSDPIVIGQGVELGGDATAALARDGGLFAIAVVGELGAPVRIVRLRPSGDIVGPSEQVLRMGPPMGLVCSMDQCVVTSGFGPTLAASFQAGDGPLDPLRYDPLPGLSGFTVAFDGNAFLSTYTEGNDLRVARIDGDAWAAGRTKLHNEQVAGAASVAPEELFVFTVRQADQSLRLRVVHDGELPREPSTSGAGGAGGDMQPTPTPPRAASGCGCAMPGSSDGSAAALVGALLLVLGGRRRLRRRGARDGL